MLHEDDVLPRGIESPFLSVLQAKNDTKNLFGRKLGESAENNKTLPFFSVTELRKQFKLLAVPFKSLRCCLRSDKHVWKFYKDLFLNFRVASWPDLSVKSYFLMVSSLMLLGSLRVYILKQLFFSVSVNSGFRKIYPLFTSISKNNC